MVLHVSDGVHLLPPFKCIQAMEPREARDGSSRLMLRQHGYNLSESESAAYSSFIEKCLVELTRDTSLILLQAGVGHPTGAFSWSHDGVTNPVLVASNNTNIILAYSFVAMR